MAQLIHYKGEYNRGLVAKDTKSIYIFTDNWNRSSGKNVIPTSSNYYKKYGKGKTLYYPTQTQAVLRGLDNCFPISTMRTQFKDQITDDYLYKFTETIKSEINDIIEYAKYNQIERVYFIKGIGKGKYSNMPKFAPKCHEMLNKYIVYLEDELSKLNDFIDTELKF